MKHPPKPFTVEVKRSRRKTPSLAQPELTGVDADLNAPSAGDMPSVLPAPQRRILPSLEEPRSLPAPAPRRRRKRLKSAPRPEVERDPAEGVAAMAGEVEPPVAAVEGRAGPVLASRLWKKEGKLPRASFSPGERWKYRLPIAVHRLLRRQRKL